MKPDKILIAIFFIILASASFSFIDFSPKDPVSIAAWNIHIFGPKKAANASLVKQYLDIILMFDIVFLQEIRDVSGTAISVICEPISMTHNCINSSRAGSATYKEQYLIVYDKKFELIEFIDYNLLNYSSMFFRPPIKATFNYNNINFTLYGIHVQPKNASYEIKNLELVAENNGNVIVLGDLNADCSYYKCCPDFKNWEWTIKKSTTLSLRECVYDRIIINHEMGKRFISASVYKENITTELSDHYLVYAIFDLG